MTPAEPIGGTPRAVFFDFDGVILESTDIKTEAFRDLYSDYPDLVPAILEHHQQYLGVSRFKKFEWVQRELLGKTLSGEERQSLGERYSDLVLDRVLTCPAVPGAHELLRTLRGTALTFIVSATPQEELELIVERRGLAGFFDEVRGAPANKVEIITDLLARYNLSTDQCVLIGDGISDYRAAAATGVRFILRETEAQEEHFRDLEPERVADLREVQGLFERASTPQADRE